MTIRKHKIAPFYRIKLPVIVIILFGFIDINPLNCFSANTYFQQKVNYTIRVTLNDTLHELNAFEEIQYFNNSPDTLREIYFHLWPNAYSNNKTALAKQLIQLRGKQKLFKDPQLRGYIDSLNFKINGKQVEWHLTKENPDIAIIKLNSPLLPGRSLNLTTPFHVKIPKGVTSRLGHIGQSYQISQWFPKPAVYDQQGWHPMPYLDQGEFYSEFGDFDVTITLPSNYIVGASGVLQNKPEEDFLNKTAADTSWMGNMVKEFNFPASSGVLKTLHYKGRNIHDFAWFADKRFHVLKGTIRLPNSGKEVSTMVLFTDEQAQLWKNALGYVNRAILYFSRLIGDYPYESFTAVQSALSAGSGMEYPGITVIGIAKNAYSLDEVIAHEIGHNWFYGALGFNERRYPFLDEGITSAYEFRYTTHFYPGKKMWEAYFKKYKVGKFFHLNNLPIHRINELEWLLQDRENREQALNLTSTAFSADNYEIMLYDKAPIAYNYLRAYLGDSLFDSIMQDFYRKMKFTHPQPKDLREIFEKESKKDLSWFFNDLIGTTKRIDYKVRQLKDSGLLIKNKGEIQNPFPVAEMKKDSIVSHKWQEGFSGKKWINLPLTQNYTRIQIDPNHVMPEIYRINNDIRTKGIFRTAGPFNTQFYLTIEDPDKSTIMYFPAVNWTRENGFMIGMAFHNGIFLRKKVEYFLMPFYGFNNSFAGYGKLTWNLIPFAGNSRQISFSLEGSRFGAPGNQSFNKIKTGVEVYFKEKQSSGSFRHMVYGNYIAASNLEQILNGTKASTQSFYQVGYAVEKNTLVNPLNLTVDLEQSYSWLKTSFTANYRLSYYGIDKGLNFRFFAGKMFGNIPANSLYNLAPSGRAGREEYLYSGTFPDRFAQFPGNFWSRQMFLDEGGLITPINHLPGYSDWLFSLSVNSDLPGKFDLIPVKPFINFLINDHNISSSSDFPFFYEAGIKAGVWNLFEIYFPFLVSNNLSQMAPTLHERIRFIFNLNFLLNLRKNRKA